MPKYLFGKPVGQLVKTSPHLPLKLQRWLARPLPYIASGRMEDFGLPTPNHNFLEAHPTVSSELLLRLGSGDAVAKPNVAELLGDSVRFEDGTVEQIDAIVYATGYKITFPFFDESLLSAPGQPPAALQAHLQAGHRRPGADRLRAGDPDAVPVRRAAEQARRRATPTATTRCRPRPRWRPRSSADDRRRTAATLRPPPAHDAGRLVPLRARHPRQARCRPDASARAAEWPPRSRAARTGPAGPSPQLPERRDVELPERRATSCAAWHLRGRGRRRSPAPDGRPCVVMAHGHRRHPRLRPAAVRARRSPTPASTSLLFDYRGFGDSTGRAAPARLPAPPPRRLPRRGRVRPRPRRRRPRPDRPLGHLLVGRARRLRRRRRPSASPR